MNKEEWRPVVNFEGCYEVSNFGRVRSVDRFIIQNRINKKVEKKLKGAAIKICKDTNGYYVVNFSKNSILKKIGVHRLVAQAFIPNPNNKPYINHIDNNGFNNMVNNLEWCTPQENSNHAKKQGRTFSPKGDEHYKSKIKESQVLEIRELLDSGVTVTKIAKLYKVNQPIISNIKSGRTYKHV